VTGLVLDLPSGGGESFGWLIGRIGSGDPAFANDLISFRLGAGFGLSLDGRPLAALTLGAPADAVEVAPGVTMRPVEEDRLAGFLRREWSGFDHLGINLSHRDIDEAAWHRLIAAVAAELPAWRLEIGSANDIVMLVKEGDGATSVVEMVLDRRADRSSFHVCARVAADRAAVEAEFPAPFGAYKPGDEPFFRSVALPVSARLPSYLDLAFSDAQMGPWPAIVAAMGKRIA
jgi:hypothetical protein